MILTTILSLFYVLLSLYSSIFSLYLFYLLYITLYLLFAVKGDNTVTVLYEYRINTTNTYLFSTL